MMQSLYESPHPDNYPTEADDGTPHLAYFAENTSFVWSGSAERPIQVCTGGYGEPVTDHIWPDMTGVGHNFTTVLHKFKGECDRYLRTRERDPQD